MGSIARNWERIGAWYAEHVPWTKRWSTIGASDRQIADVESRLGFELPQPMKESYRVHNGTAECWLVHYDQLQAIGELPGLRIRFEEMLSRWNELVPSEVEGRIKPDWWNRHWIPVTGEGVDDSIQVDLDPAPGGKRGQVIYWSHEVGPARVLADDFGQWIERIADDLEAGEYMYYEAEETVAPVGMY